MMWASSRPSTMNTKKVRGRIKIAFLQWLLYMQIPCNKRGNPSYSRRSARLESDIYIGICESVLFYWYRLSIGFAISSNLFGSMALYIRLLVQNSHQIWLPLTTSQTNYQYYQNVVPIPSVTGTRKVQT